MSEKLAKYAAARRARSEGAKDENGRQQDRPREDKLSPEDQRTLSTIQREARRRGAVLAHGGKGGLPPSLALRVFRRDKYRCKSCDTTGSEDNGITLHHKGGIPESEWLSQKGHHNDENNLVALCEKCHDREHQEARAEGVDSSQVTPEGDVGTRRDKGKPIAHPSG